MHVTNSIWNIFVIPIHVIHEYIVSTNTENPKERAVENKPK